MAALTASSRFNWSISSFRSCGINSRTKPDLSSKRMTVSIPHGGGHFTAGPHDTAHFGDRALSVRDELQDQHREGPIERGVTEWQRTGVCLPDRDTWISVSSTCVVYVDIRLIYTDRRWSKISGAVLQAVSGARTQKHEFKRRLHSALRL
jgi:hypothetical protein